jgi:myo-inositol 2-dehydrogenase/D-chiro-inositol 1-dehydrogenase
VEVATGAGFNADPVQDFFLERYAEAYRLEMDAFISGAATGTAMNPSGEDGLAAQLLADAATEACFSGRPVLL